MPEDLNKKNYRFGKVVNVGDGAVEFGVHVYPSTTLLGRTILFDQMSGTVVSDSDGDYVILKDMEIVAVLSEDDD